MGNSRQRRIALVGLIVLILARLLFPEPGHAQQLSGSIKDEEY